MDVCPAVRRSSPRAEDDDAPERAPPAADARTYPRASPAGPSAVWAVAHVHVVALVKAQTSKSNYV